MSIGLSFGASGFPEAGFCGLVTAAALFSLPRIPEKYWFPTVLGLMAIPFLTFLLSASALLLGLPLSGWIVAVAVGLTVGLMKRFSLRGTLYFTVPAVLLIWLLTLLFSALTWDFTQEGESFQKPTAFLLAQGWNPIYSPDPLEFLRHASNLALPSDALSADAFDRIAVTFYPKGLAMISAVYFNAFGSLEAGDSVYFSMILASLCLFYHLLRIWLGLNQYETLGVALVLVLSPSLMAMELFSGMEAGCFALCFLTFLLSGIVWIQSGNRKWRPFVLGSLIFGCSLQFSALWFFLILAGALSLSFRKAELTTEETVTNEMLKEKENEIRPDALFLATPKLTAKRWFQLLAVAFVLILFTGVHPFITNSVRMGNPFYPFSGFSVVPESKNPAMSPYFANPNFLAASQFQRLIFCQLDARRPPRPGEVSGPEHDASAVHFLSLFSTKPFGIFPFVFLISFPLAVFLRTRTNWLVIGGILVGLTAYPYFWNEHFAPQLHAFPILLMACIMAELRLNRKNTLSQLSESVLKSRANMLFHVVLICLCWVSLLSFGTAVKQQVSLSRACRNVERVLSSPNGESMTLCPIWEQLSANANTPPKHVRFSPRPWKEATLYLRLRLASDHPEKLRLQEAKALEKLDEVGLLPIRTLLFKVPMEKIEKKTSKQKEAKQNNKNKK